MSAQQVTKAVPFYKIPSADDRPLLSVDAGMDVRYAQEVVDRILNFLTDRVEARFMGEQEDMEEAWVHWFLLGLVKALREASGDVQ